MHTNADKITESKTTGVANTLAEQTVNRSFYLQDNRSQSLKETNTDNSTPIQFTKPENRVDIRKAHVLSTEKTKQKARDDFAERNKKSREAAMARRRYGEGTHGFKKSEQKRLSEAHDMDVTGNTHESEHIIGFEPLNRTSGLKRGTAGRARNLENIAPAYQEVKELHRDHIGTGTQMDVDESGFNSQSYRDTQRQLVTDGDVSSAVQINQLGYAFDSRFRATGKASDAADDSYNTMVTHMNKVTYASGDDNTEVDVPAKQKAEMLLAREAAKTGKFPSVEQENEVRKKLGLALI